MSWNYRVIRHIHTHNDIDEEYYQIHEVFYDDDGNPETMTVEGIIPFGDTEEDLKEVMEMMANALTKNVLDAIMFEHDDTNKLDKTLGMIRNV